MVSVALRFTEGDYSDRDSSGLTIMGYGNLLCSTFVGFLKNMMSHKICFFSKFIHAIINIYPAWEWEQMSLSPYFRFYELAKYTVSQKRPTLSFVVTFLCLHQYAYDLASVIYEIF